MNQYSIQNAQAIQFKAAAKFLADDGFQTQGYVLLGHSGNLDLVVFQGENLPANFAHNLDVALPLSTDARPAQIVRLFQRPAVQALFARLHAGHDIRWNGSYNVGVFTPEGVNALEGLRDLLDAFNLEAELDAIAA